tara:strand:- start:26 stop:532 length:507 start_codon:yes stop_codon:yes gene_type:complete
MDVLEHSIVDFFSDAGNFLKLKTLICDKNLQPRLIDYYVTQYAKNNPEFFIDNESISDVYNSYKLQLKGYHKRQFCLFSKKHPVAIKSGTSVLHMPLAKINVYKWLISNQITDMLNDKHLAIQKKYYDFRKISFDKNRKRGKMTTHLKTPALINGIVDIKLKKKKYLT